MILLFYIARTCRIFVTDRISASATAKSKLSKELNGASPHKIAPVATLRYLLHNLPIKPFS